MTLDKIGSYRLGIMSNIYIVDRRFICSLASQRNLETWVISALPHGFFFLTLLLGIDFRFYWNQKSASRLGNSVGRLAEAVHFSLPFESGLQAIYDNDIVNNILRKQTECYALECAERLSRDIPVWCHCLYYVLRDEVDFSLSLLLIPL